MTPQSSSSPSQPPLAIREWTVGSAVVKQGDEVLLVENRRRDGSLDWTTPGGVIDHGESVLDGIAREVHEETGIVIERWTAAPLYTVDVVAEGLGWHLTVHVHHAAAWRGSITVDDPDGIVQQAAFLRHADCRARIEPARPWVREPMTAWLDGPWSGTRSFGYELLGESLSSLDIRRR